MHRSQKIGLCVAAIAFSVGAIVTTYNAQLYPALPAGTAVAAISVYFSTIHREQYLAGILSSITVGVAYRATVFLWPATMIGHDPDSYAVRSYAYLHDGLPTGVGGFYEVAAAFPVYGSISALVTGLPVTDAYLFLPIVVGVLVPAFAAVFASNHSPKAGAIAAFLISLGPSTIQYSTNTIPLTLAALLFTVFVFCLEHQSRAQYRTPETVIIAVLAASMAMATHKIPGLLIIGVGVALAGTAAIRRNHAPVGVYGLIGIAGGIVVLQWVYATPYAAHAAGLIVGIATAVFTIAPEQAVSAGLSHATAFGTGLLYRLRALWHFPIILVGSGIVWLSLLINKPSRHQVLRATAAVTVAIMIPGIVFNSGPGFKRVFVYGSIFVFVLVAIGLATLDATSTPRATLASGCVIVLAVLLIFSSPTTPDYRDSPDLYLSSGSVDAKHWMYDYMTDPAAMDSYYADEVVDIPRAITQERQYRTVFHARWHNDVFGTALLNGTIGKYNQTIALRKNIGAYRIHGRYTLTYNPHKQMEARNQFYDSNRVAIYGHKNTSTSRYTTN